MDNAEIKTALEKVLADKKKYPGAVVQMNDKNFKDLFADVQTWAEKNQKAKLEDNDKGKKRLAVVMHQQFPAKLQPVNKKIGPFSVNDLEPRPEQHHPTHTTLAETFSAKESAKVRDEVVLVLGLKDKNHPSHKNSFSDDQTLEKIITNVIDPVTGDEERSRVAKLLSRWYPKYKLTWRR
jgi:hypothetical protein